jgi:hypothetical protein
MMNDNEAERCTVVKARLITGLSSRVLQAMALRGEIDGAAKLGGLWTFDEERLRAWVKSKEQRPTASTKGAAFGTVVSPSTGRNIESRYARLIKGKRNYASHAG